MTWINGHPSNSPTITMPNPSIGIGGPANPPSADRVSVIDGTPTRVVVMAFAAAAGIAALRMAGFRFNVGVST